MNKKFYLLIYLITSFQIGFAQDNLSVREDLNVPTLNGHRFVQNQLIPQAFIKTTFGVIIGYGDSERIDFPTFQIADSLLIDTKGKLFFGTLGLEYNQKVKDWISLYFSYVLTARVGTEPAGVLTQGLNTFNGFRLGWKFKLWENNKNMLSLSTGLENYTGNFVNVFGYVSDVINNNPNPSVSEDVPVLNGTLGINHAVGFNSLLGMQSSVEIGYGESFVRGNTNFNYVLATSLDLNMYPKWKVPVGVNLGFAYRSAPEYLSIEKESVNIFNLVIAYTGSKDLFINLEMSNSRLPVITRPSGENKSKVDVTDISLRMIYFFN